MAAAIFLLRVPEAFRSALSGRRRRREVQTFFSSLAALDAMAWEYRWPPCAP